jgi:hypothetical protein
MLFYYWNRTGYVSLAKVNAISSLEKSVSVEANLLPRNSRFLNLQHANYISM